MLLLLKNLIQLGIMASVNATLDKEIIELIALEQGYEVKDEVVTDVTRYDEFITEDKPEDLELRPAIITIVDVSHGKRGNFADTI